jgi:glycosyltransferase involved in cell wall biosynthesis
MRTMPVVLTDKWIDQMTPGVLHFHWPSYAYSDLNRAKMAEYIGQWARTLLRAKTKGFKIVWTAHNLYPHEQMHADLERDARFLLVELCDAVIVHCCAATGLLREHFGMKARHAVIPHGHYCGVYGKTWEAGEARQKLGLENDGTVYLFFGQMRAYKGLDGLLNVFGSMPEDRGTLVVAGAALDADLARRIIGKNRQQRNVVVHPFFIPDAEVGLYLGAADVIVLPYRDVLTSGATVLAHSMGRPVIANAQGCMREMVPEGTGWLYDSDEDEALREVMESAAGRLKAETADRCVQFALTRDWAAVGEKTLALYSSL